MKVITNTSSKHVRRTLIYLILNEKSETTSPSAFTLCFLRQQTYLIFSLILRCTPWLWGVACGRLKGDTGRQSEAGWRMPTKIYSKVSGIPRKPSPLAVVSAGQGAPVPLLIVRQSSTKVNKNLIILRLGNIFCSGKNWLPDMKLMHSGDGSHPIYIWWVVKLVILKWLHRSSVIKLIFL